ILKLLELPGLCHFIDNEAVAVAAEFNSPETVEQTLSEQATVRATGWTQSRKSSFEDRPAAEGRVPMPRQIAALLFALTVLSAAALSQSNQKPNAVGQGSIATVDFVRPRVVAATDPSTIASTEREAFALINKKRADAFLEPLIWNDELAELARQHSDDMARF